MDQDQENVGIGDFKQIADPENVEDGGLTRAVVTARQERERMSKQLSRSRPAITGKITAKRNILHKLMATLTDIKAASVVLDQYVKLVEKFRDCHLEYQATLTEKQRDIDKKRILRT